MSSLGPTSILTGHSYVKILYINVGVYFNTQFILVNCTILTDAILVLITLLSLFFFAFCLSHYTLFQNVIKVLFV